MAYAGRTTAPCEGCGQKPDEGRYGREKGKVCPACQRLMEDGRRARAATAAAAKVQPERPYRWTGSAYDVDLGYRVPHDERDALGRAFAVLVQLIAPVAAPGTNTVMRTDVVDGRDPFTHRKRKEEVAVPWPWLLEMSEDRARSHTWTCREAEDHRMLRPEVREALEALRLATKAAIDGAYQDGKEHGGSALRRLAAGEITLNEYDDTLLPDKERSRRRG